MEGNGCHQRWRMHLPHLKHSKTLSPTPEDSRETKKYVSMAVTSRYLTDRHYVMRKPLFTTEQHLSILKKFTEKEKKLCVNRRELADMKPMTGQREALIPEKYGLSHHSISPSPTTREDPRLTLSALDQPQLCCGEPPLGPLLHGARAAKQSLSSSVLEVQKLNPPVRPPLTSTVLYPTYTPRSGYSKPDQTQIRLWDRDGTEGGEAKLRSPAVSKVASLSSSQENYWICAIPKGLPPSSDRKSASWNPNKEYKALLDYTYPLRPVHVESEWDISEQQGDSLPQTDAKLQDSGIELDHLFNSTSLSEFGFSGNEVGETRESNTLSASYRSPDLQGFTRSSDCPFSSTQLSPTDTMDLSFVNLDCGGTHNHKNDGCHHHRHTMLSSNFRSFIHSTSVLPRFTCDCGDIDEDFWPLPEQLEGLQQLSRQVRELTAKLTCPVTARCESLHPGTTSIPSSTHLPEKQGDEERAGDLRGSETSRKIFGSRVETDGGGFVQSRLREMGALVEWPCDPTIPSPKNRPEDQDQNYTLMQHIQVFCSQLELLIQQLYAVSRRMERLAAPTVDIDSVRSSMTEYQHFQREVCSQQPLTSTVLHAGQHLLRCINVSSPLLRDTLLLIERESGALQTYTDHFFSSILSAMHSLTEPPHPCLKQRREEEPGITSPSSS
ncbi:centrosomal protein of 68 kDa isoform X2 [Cololabis saira]|uniref:centrosomal protein of 68 kDa isoform X2 n=1 Tax=Cololabis saira TaxID=129043 RepID=UPI002AD598DC|nr:centrosomal protein of 68 kDa isoform X2 [Cololabis saira]